MYNENITVIQAELHCFILKWIFGQMCLLHKYRSFTWLDYGMKQVAKDIRLPSKNVHRSFSLNITTWTQRFYLGNANMIIIVLFFLWRLSSYLGNKTMQVVTYNLSMACNKHDAWALCLRWGLKLCYLHAAIEFNEYGKVRIIIYEEPINTLRIIIQIIQRKIYIKNLYIWILRQKSIFDFVKRNLYLVVIQRSTYFYDIMHNALVVTHG